MGRVIAIANQKGGVGKTTTAINVAVALARIDGPVLLIDLDPQANATSGLTRGTDTPASGPPRSTIYDALVERLTLTSIIRSARERLDLAPAGHDLVAAEIELASVERREYRLKSAICDVVYKYNHVLIDTPPSLGLLTLNALVAADAVIIPMQCEYYALEGLSALLATIRRVRASLNPALDVDGIVLTMYDSRNRLCRDVEGEVRGHFPDKAFATVIPRNVRLSESPSHGLSVLEYDPRSTGAESYRRLAGEIAARSARASALSQTAESKPPSDQENKP